MDNLEDILVTFCAKITELLSHQQREIDRLKEQYIFIMTYLQLPPQRK